MPFTSFDTTFDHTFAKTSAVSTPVFPPTGGDGGGGISGAVLPFSTYGAGLSSCLNPQGQGWERWSGIPISLPGYIMPFVLAVPMPDNLATSPFCTQPLQIVDADLGAVVLTPYDPGLHRLTDGNTLYIVGSGIPIRSDINSPAELETGSYRLTLASAVSEPFSVRCGVCTLFQIRLLNDARLGDLLYGSFGFQQVFYVEGDLTGPIYDETETRTGTEKTGGSVKKSWRLSLDGASEPVADCLAMAGLTRLVEVSVVSNNGTPTRSIQALEYEAKSAITINDSGGFDVVLTLPVGSTSWKTGSGEAGCLVDAGGNTLTQIECDPVGAPEWTWLNRDIPTPVAGKRFSLRIPLSALTPAEGEVINETGIITVSSWLGGYYEPGSSEYNLTGIAPSEGTLKLVLYGRQTANSGNTAAGLTAIRTFEKTILAHN